VARSLARPPEGSPIARALEAVAQCQARYRTITDYTCTFYKRERVDGRLTGLHVMTMKVRRSPGSIYVRFQQPGAGREAIYVSGRNGGKLLAHDVGFNKLLAGTLSLEPTCARAMEDNRHPITEAGIGPLLDTLAKRWAMELSPDEAVVVFRDDGRVAQRHCSVIEVTHPNRRQHFLHHKVRVYIDKGLGLPIRFEAYDWPPKGESPANLTEEYTYMNLKLNVGLRDIDFDSANPEYSFGRF
jgi:outer membrane lipoprotein-sorting protein